MLQFFKTHGINVNPMASIVVKTDFALDTQQLLDSLTQLNVSELEDFYESLGRLLESRRGEPSGSSLFPIADSATEESDLPIVETLMPKSIVLDGDRIRF